MGRASLQVRYQRMLFLSVEDNIQVKLPSTLQPKKIPRYPDNREGLVLGSI